MKFKYLALLYLISSIILVTADQTTTFTLPTTPGACSNFTIAKSTFTMCVKSTTEIYGKKLLVASPECQANVEWSRACSWTPSCSSTTHVCWVEKGTDCYLCSRDLLHNGGVCWTVLSANSRRYMYAMSKTTNVPAYIFMTPYITTNIRMEFQGKEFIFHQDKVFTDEKIGISLRMVASSKEKSMKYDSVTKYRSHYWIKNFDFPLNTAGSPYFCTCSDATCTKLQWDKGAVRNEIRTTGSSSQSMSHENYFSVSSKYFSTLDSKLGAGCTIKSTADTMHINNCGGGIMSFEITAREFLISRSIIAKVRSVETVSVNCTDYYGSVNIRLKVSATQGSAPLESPISCNPKVVNLVEGENLVVIICQMRETKAVINLKIGGMSAPVSAECVVSNMLSDNLREYSFTKQNDQKEPTWWEKLVSQYGLPGAIGIVIAVSLGAIIGVALVVSLAVFIVKMVIKAKTGRRG